MRNNYYPPGPGDRVFWPRGGRLDRPNTFEVFDLNLEWKYDPVLLRLNF